MVELCLAVTLNHLKLSNHKRAEHENDSQQGHTSWSVVEMIVVEMIVVDMTVVDNFLPLSHLLEHGHGDCSVEELCLSALGLAMTLQLVSKHTERHLEVCRDGLCLVDHPDQGVIAHQRPVSACRRSVGDQEISCPSPCTKNIHDGGNMIFLHIEPQTHTCLQLKKSSR